ncbi:MAG: isoprenyl transferase [Candidatus Marinimicrobia bacterium]|nr:isoprenyl transferase [Candidatus Neomarinimicrobiota bacterium]
MNTEALIGIQERIIANGDLPTHLAIIMDGNGRWAQNKGLPRVAGHKEGVVSVREITRACGELGIDVLTLYTFSSDNWKRPRSEVNALMRLLVSTIRAEVRELMDNNVRLTAIGRLDDLPEIAQQEFHSAMEQTAANNGLNLNLALSYGGRQEILTAIQRLLKAGLAGNLTPEQVTEELFSDYLYTAGLPDPDLIVRTGGETRLSNFLIWQSAYSELIITDAMWPDFRQQELYHTIELYQQRERRFGLISEQVHSTVNS